jgi:hypothetical protein
VKNNLLPLKRVALLADFQAAVSIFVRLLLAFLR